MRLENRVAIVTGGGRAIGKRIALRLADEGANLVIAAPEADEIAQTVAEAQELGRRAIAVVTDVSVEDQVQAMARAALDEFGQIDILVNNSGVVGPTATVPAISRAEWDAVMDVNVTGPFMCSKAVLQSMIERRSGKIINISSVAGKMGYALRSPYATSKWALIGLTLTLAKENGEHNIQVNAVCPGPVEGDRMNGIFESRAAELGRTVEDVKQKYLDTMLLKRLVQPDDVAAMVVYLASDDANAITGQALDVSAGYGV